MNDERYDVAVVGAGILGLAHAYHLSQAGLKVAVFERHGRPVGASIRNFGMIWPVGQPVGEIRDSALESRRHWLDVLQAAGIWHRECGSLHLAYAPDELAVLEEFAGLGVEHGYKACMVSAVEAVEKSPPVKTEGLLGALWNPEELCVYPRQVMQRLPEFLSEGLGVRFHFNAPVVGIEEGRLYTGSGSYRAERIVVCPGDELRTLFPDLFGTEDIRLCKLQMLRARPKESDFRIHTHLCAGLTLAHYANFQICGRLPRLIERFARDYPEHVEWGIHLLVSQHEDGLLTIGDSHEYPGTPDPFLSARIEELILGYLDTFLPVDRFEVTERWHGVYAKHFSKPYALLRPSPGVAVIAGVGGTGMTLSFGLAAKVLRDLGWAGKPAAAVQSGGG